jgi:hypothetical protein
MAIDPPLSTLVDQLLRDAAPGGHEDQAIKRQPLFNT